MNENKTPQVEDKNEQGELDSQRVTSLELRMSDIEQAYIALNEAYNQHIAGLHVNS